LIRGAQNGAATIIATADGKTDQVLINVINLTGEWIGGESPDTVRYSLVQIGTKVDGVFKSTLGFPPITNVNTGPLSGSLNFGRYFHNLELTTEEGCEIRMYWPHNVEISDSGELILSPESGSLSSTNCSISGTIDFATLRRE